MKHKCIILVTVASLNKSFSRVFSYIHADFLSITSEVTALDRKGKHLGYARKYCGNFGIIELNHKLKG